MPRTGRTTDGQLARASHDAAAAGGASTRRAREVVVDPDEVTRLRSEVERLRNELFLARKEAQQLRRQVRLETYQQLVTTLGHELRTSLTLVLGWTELLLNGKLPEDKQAQAHDTVYAAGWRVEAALRALERTIERDQRVAEAVANSEPMPDVEARLAESTMVDNAK
jgi:signal transduction histidine kinase